MSCTICEGILSWCRRGLRGREELIWLASFAAEICICVVRWFRKVDSVLNVRNRPKMALRSCYSGRALSSEKNAIGIECLEEKRSDPLNG